jgi:hypothetical protein
MTWFSSVKFESLTTTSAIKYQQIYINNAKGNHTEMIDYRRTAFVMARKHLIICDISLGDTFVIRPHDNSISAERERVMDNF